MKKFKMLTDTIKTLNYEKEATIAIDVAAEHFFLERNLYLSR